MIVILLGYMASGKSSVGRILASKLNYAFIDLDDYIESQENISVKDIFKTKGEVYFRHKESLYLDKILNEKDNLILSLGGGTPCYGDNMQLILNSDNAKSIYLKTSIPTLISRLEGEKGKRPLIANIKTKDLLIEFISKHLFERSQFYDQAHKIVTTDDKTEPEIVKEIGSKLL